MTNALCVNNLSVQRGRTIVCRDIDLTVKQGEWFGVIGANGSGKTSLLRAMSGRLPIQRGQCVLAGQDQAKDRLSRATAIELAPPPEYLPESLTPRGVFRLLSDQWQDNIAPVSVALGIDAMLDKRIGLFSAGMRQRVAIASSFARGRAFVILDEPFNWLDPVAAFDLRVALRTWVRNGGTLMTALHDMTTLAAACDAGALLANGQVIRRLDAAQLESAKSDPIEFEATMIAELRSHTAIG